MIFGCFPIWDARKVSAPLTVDPPYSRELRVCRPSPPQAFWMKHT